MRKNTRKLKATRKKSISNAIERRGGLIHQKQHQARRVAPKEVKKHEEKH
jgi:hypothetical protein